MRAESPTIGLADSRVDDELDAGSLRCGLRRLNAVDSERAEIDFGPVEHELARVGLRDEQEIADEMEQAVDIAVDDLQELTVLGRELVCVVEDELEVAANRGQRRSQLVRDERHELVLQAVEAAKPFVLCALALEGLCALARAGRARSSCEQSRRP